MTAPIIRKLFKFKMIVLMCLIAVKCSHERLPAR